MMHSRIELYPVFGEDSGETSFDPHYAIQGGWVLRGLVDRRPSRHVDVGSQIPYLPFFAALAPTTFVDIRPSGLRYPGLTELSGSIFDLDRLVGQAPSISCLHVVEHVGLGRYGDPLDPRGTERACGALASAVEPGGYLYLSTPIGRPRVCFNAHRVSTASQIADWVGLDLETFDAVGDDGQYYQGADLDAFDDAEYALGLFGFAA